MHEYRHLLEKVLEGTNLEGDDCCLRGFGTLEENKIFHEIYKDQRMVITNLMQRKIPIGKL